MVDSLPLGYLTIENDLKNQMPGMFFVTLNRQTGSLPMGFLKAIFACIH
jgi:hypothetical protein